MSKFVKLNKPGTTKYQSVESEKVDYYRQFGWEPVEPQEEKIVLHPAKKTAKKQPAVEILDEEIPQEDPVEEIKEEVDQNAIDKGE